MLDYNALFALSAVIRAGSFEGAARTLNVTPSAISQRIRQLEERVGCVLVIRDQPCRATDIGQRLCHHIDQVRLLEHELQDAVPSVAMQEQIEVTLPIAVNADSLATWFMPALGAFTAESPALVDLMVDDEDHTSGWLRSGKVLASVTASTQRTAGCNTRALGAMRYLAVASPSFMKKHFKDGVGAGSLARAPSLAFSTKDALQARWARRHCHRSVELPHHTLPSTEAFVSATLAGMGWGMHPEALVKAHIKAGRLVVMVPNSALDVSLHWQYARSASSLLDRLSHHIVKTAEKELISD